MIDFDRIMRAPAWYDMGIILADWRPMPLDRPFPPLANRLSAARAYIAACDENVVRMYPRRTPEDVVFDANKGVVLRMFMQGFNYVGTMGLKQPPPFPAWQYFSAAKVG